MVRISDKAVDKIRGNNSCVARLMIAFNKHAMTIDRWLNSKDIRLTTPGAIQIIEEETELKREEILEECTEDNKANMMLG